MPISGLFDSFKPLEAGLNAVALRGEVIANNIANVDTPGFKTSHVEFEKQLKDKLDGYDYSMITNKTRAKHIDFSFSDSVGTVVQDVDTTMRMDENNVDIDKEMAAQADNLIEYNALIRKISDQFKRLNYAIEGK